MIKRLTSIPRIVLVMGITWILLGGFIAIRYKTPIKRTVAVSSELPSMTIGELAAYDGSDLTKPVYLAMEGYIYDISSGRESFYNVGMPYHFLAGVDATAELRIAGGSIIAKKYPIIAKLVN